MVQATEDTQADRAGAEMTIIVKIDNYNPWKVIKPPTSDDRINELIKESMKKNKELFKELAEK